MPTQGADCAPAATRAVTDYERFTRSREDLLDDYVLLRSEGFTWRQCAQRLGMTYVAFKRALLRPA